MIATYSIPPKLSFCKYIIKKYRLFIKDWLWFYLDRVAKTWYNGMKLRKGAHRWVILTIFVATMMPKNASVA